jgi:hypothetical protein
MNYPDSPLPTKLCVEGIQKWHGMGSFASRLILTNLSPDTRDSLRHSDEKDESEKVTLVVVPKIMQSCCDVIFCSVYEIKAWVSSFDCITVNSVCFI